MCSESLVYFGLSSEDGNLYLGWLDFFDNQVNLCIGIICGCVVFDNVKGEFILGFYVCLKLVGSKIYVVILIKDEVVGIDLGKKFVLVLDGDNKIVYCIVEMGLKLEGLCIVCSGLSKGDWIVVNGLQWVCLGMQVDLQKVEMVSVDILGIFVCLWQLVGDSELLKVVVFKDNVICNELCG